MGSGHTENEHRANRAAGFSKPIAICFSINYVVGTGFLTIRKLNGSDIGVCICIMIANKSLCHFCLTTPPAWAFYTGGIMLSTLIETM